MAAVLARISACHEVLFDVEMLEDSATFHYLEDAAADDLLSIQGLDRIVAFHERQDRRYAEAAASISQATGKPILVATELAVAAPDNPGPAAVRETGRLAYPSSQRAVRALHHLWRYARQRAGDGAPTGAG